MDVAAVAGLLSVPTTWVYEQTRARATDPIPHQRFGRYLRFDLNDPDLLAWIERHKVSKQRNGNEPKRKEDK